MGSPGFSGGAKVFAKGMKNIGTNVRQKIAASPGTPIDPSKRNVLGKNTSIKRGFATKPNSFLNLAMRFSDPRGPTGPNKTYRLPDRLVSANKSKPLGGGSSLKP
jgi:hypothetical protein